MKDLSIHTIEFENLLKEFKKELSVKQYSKNYQYKNYSQAREFLFYCESREIIWVNNIKAQDVLDYHDYISMRPNQRLEGTLSETAINSHFGSIKMFFEFLENTNIIEASPVNLPSYQRAKYNQREIATREEIKELYEVAKDSREKAILSLAYGCGLRRGEIQALNVSDVMLYKGILVVRNGKNSKSRRVPMSDKVIQDLKAYLFERQKYIKSNANHSDGFLVGEWGRRLSGAMIYQCFRRILERTQNLKLFKKKLCLHSLRHSIATHLLDNGASIEFVQRFLGHADIDMAHHYSKRRKQRLAIQNAAEKYYNPNKRLGYD